MGPCWEAAARRALWCPGALSPATLFPSLAGFMTGPVLDVRFSGIPEDDTRYAGGVDDSRQ
eukprot:5269301-Heterocapsa_arctica.AAC.1